MKIILINLLNIYIKKYTQNKINDNLLSPMIDLSKIQNELLCK